MKTTFSSSLAFAVLLAAMPAQQPAAAPKTTAAEQAFRDGWWAESGQGDLATALAKYLAAATAEGPAAVRAKALLNAGAVQQRLGKAESAIATFRQLLKEHPEQADLVEQARVHLRELTAVDLTTGYDEWYERRLFSEEVQVQILDKIQAMAKSLSEGEPSAAPEQAQQRQQRQLLRGEILAFGKGAVPALRKACESGNDRLAEAAVELLFDLGQLPPFQALRRLDGWTNESDHWLALLRARSTEPRSLPQDATQHERLVFAALTGAGSLIDAMLEGDFGEADGAVSAATLALASFDGNARQRLREAMVDRRVPLATRRALYRALLATRKPPFTAGQWLAIGEDPLLFEVRGVAVHMAARQLGAQDGALLDTLFDRVAGAPASSREEFVASLVSGVREHRSLLLLPWSAERMRYFVNIAGTGSDSSVIEVLDVLRGDDELRAMLAAAMLSDPVALAAVWKPAPDAAQPMMTLNAMFAWDAVEERQAEVFAGRWHASLRDALAAAWPKWNDAERAAALGLVTELVSGTGDGKPLSAFLTAAKPDASPTLHAPIDALLEQLKR